MLPGEPYRVRDGEHPAKRVVCIFGDSACSVCAREHVAVVIVCERGYDGVRFIVCD